METQEEKIKRIIQEETQFEKEWEEEGLDGMDAIRRLSGKYNVYARYTCKGYSGDKFVASRNSFEEAKAIADKRVEGHLPSYEEEEHLGWSDGDDFQFLVFFGINEFYDEDSDTLEYNEPVYETDTYSPAKGGPTYEFDFPIWEEDENE